MQRPIRLAGMMGVALAAGCQPAQDKQPGSPQAAFAAIGEDETIWITGTEPFWGGTITGERLLYTTPDNQAGESIRVKRFAGNSGLGFTGQRGGRPLDLTITRGACSDGMSDRRYPYTASLKLDAELRSGCAWTDRQPFSGSKNP
jgi:uncharacterized membrane protein